MDSLLMVYGRQEQGPLIPASNGSTYYFDTPYIDFSAAVFQVSGQFTNLQRLPLVPSFTAAKIGAMSKSIFKPSLPHRRQSYHRHMSMSKESRALFGSGKALLDT